MRIWVNVMEFETRRLLLIGETMLETKNVTIIYSGRPLANVSSFSMRGRDYEPVIELSVDHTPEGYISPINKNLKVINVSSEARGVNSKTEKTRTFLTITAEDWF